LRPEIKERIMECELILHAGDISSQETIDEIIECGKTYFVRGNADKGHWAEKIPAARELNLYGLQICMIHNCKLIEENISDKRSRMCRDGSQYVRRKKANHRIII
jgi:predicted phosphodiesterase